MKKHNLINLQMDSAVNYLPKAKQLITLESVLTTSSWIFKAGLLILISLAFTQSASEQIAFETGAVA